MPTSLGDAREVGRLPGRDPACPHGSEAATLHPSIRLCNLALRSATVANVKTGFAANVSWRMKQCLCPAGRPSRGPARQPGHFSCFAKRSDQEKATPEMSPRYAGFPRRWHRNREASETRCAQTADASFSVSGTGDASPSNGDSLQLQRQRQRPLHKQLQMQRPLHKQLQRSLRGATCNCNGRCAGNGNCNARIKPFSGRRHLTASMLTRLASSPYPGTTRRRALSRTQSASASPKPVRPNTL